MSSPDPSLLPLHQPIINAPMAGVAGGALAAAVSRAGGLGLVGVGHGSTTSFIDAQLELACSGAEAGTWGAGLMSWSLDLDDTALRDVLAHNPPYVALAAGDPTSHARVARRAGAHVMVQVGTEAESRAAAEEESIDVVVVRGGEGGGHGLDAVATLPLVQAAVAATTKPVVAAGGIATASGVAAVLAAGAAAAWVGTRFIPTAESLAAPGHRRAVVEAGVDDTVHTSVFDIALGLPWPQGYGGRALVNDITADFAGAGEQRLRRDLDAELPYAVATARRVARAKADGDPSAAPLYAGQSAGLVPVPDAALPSAADVVTELGGFRALLERAAARWPLPH